MTTLPSAWRDRCGGAHRYGPMAGKEQLQKDDGGLVAEGLAPNSITPPPSVPDQASDLLAEPPHQVHYHPRSNVLSVPAHACERQADTRPFIVQPLSVGGAL